MAKTFDELNGDLAAEARQKLAVIDRSEIAARIVPVVEGNLADALGELKTLAVHMVMKYATAEFDSRSGTEKNTMLAVHLFQYAQSTAKPIEFEDARMLAQLAFNAVAGVLVP